MKKFFLLGLLLLVLVTGCGSGTSGILSATAPTVGVGNGIVTSTATFKPATGTALPGQAIEFRWYSVGVDSKTKSTETVSTGYTNSDGAVTSTLNLPVDRTESLLVYVIASTGSLTNTEGWQSVLVPVP